MGERGPMPKDASERRRRNEPESGPPAKASITGRVIAPRCPPLAHPKARFWFESLKTSGQRKWFEPSDWAEALIIVELIGQLFNEEEFNASGWRAVFSRMAMLGTTIGDRRRLGIEIDREKPPTKRGEPTAISNYRDKIGAG